MDFQAALTIIQAAALAALTGVVVVVVKQFGGIASDFVALKFQGLRAKIGADKFKADLQFAGAAWQITDEHFRITPNVEKTVENAQNYFAAELRKLIPGITDAEVEQLRQAIAGTVNAGRDKIQNAIAPTAETPVTQTGATVSAEVPGVIAPDTTDAQ